MNCFVCILYSASTNIYYKGITNDLKDRLKRHNHGLEKATRRGVPWKLIWYTIKKDKGEAMILERKLKNLFRKKLLEFIEKYRVDIAGHDETDRKIGVS
jgi:putative endonuclease